ncbi:MAG: hypothetical protein ACXAC7_14475 [Candidatus Hodarchaeales archaeon]
MGLLLNSFIITQAVDRTQVGSVAVGDSFNVKVVTNTLDLAALGLELSDIEEVDFAEFGLEDLGMTISDGIETLVPQTGEVFTVSVDTLPTDTADGAINVTFKEVSQVVPTDFYIGTPVVSVDWDGWIAKLDTLIAEANALENVTAETRSRTNNDTHFQNAVRLNVPVPAKLDLGIPEVMVDHDMLYDKTTGIMEMMKIDVTADTGTVIGSLTQTFHTVKTTDPPTPKASSSSESSSSSSAFGFELVTFVITFSVIGILVKKRNK